MKLLLCTLAMLAFASAQKPKQEPTKEPCKTKEFWQGFKAACHGDRERLCPEMGKREAHACMKTHSAELSEGCKAVAVQAHACMDMWKAKMGKWKETKAKCEGLREKIHATCEADRQSLCPGKERREMRMCMHAASDDKKLSKECGDLISQAKECHPHGGKHEDRHHKNGKMSGDKNGEKKGDVGEARARWMRGRRSFGGHDEDGDDEDGEDEGGEDEGTEGEPFGHRWGGMERMSRHGGMHTRHGFHGSHHSHGFKAFTLCVLPLCCLALCAFCCGRAFERRGATNVAPSAPVVTNGVLHVTPVAQASAPVYTAQAPPAPAGYFARASDTLSSPLLSCYDHMRPMVPAEPSIVTGEARPATSQYQSA